MDNGADIFGYYDDYREHRGLPTFDPGFSVPCPLCQNPLAKPVYTMELMRRGDNRLYFYRVHRDCYHGSSEKEEERIAADLERAIGEGQVIRASGEREER